MLQRTKRFAIVRLVSSMSPLIWIQPATMAGFFFALHLPVHRAQNLYDSARYVMIGSAFSSAFDTASSVPSAALMIVDEVVFSGM